ncbi:hypothetical protein BDV93DRAFT_561742 [Ceratobasidium sp. AG-I]|nr:hypothetical protein BDV93DRAFT_561742 [Ceratobasidium sp. AG-I]
MSYEYATLNEFATPYPDWSGYPAPENDEEFISTSTNPDSQTVNYQEGSYHYAAGTAPTQDARPRSMALADEEWLNVTIATLTPNPSDLSIPYAKTIASELPVGYDQEPVWDTQISWIPMSDEEFRTLSVYMPVGSCNYQQASMPLARDQAPVETTYHNSTQDPQQFSQDLQVHQPCALVMPPVQLEHQRHIEGAPEAPMDSREQRPADPPAREMRKRRARLPPPNAWPQPTPSEPVAGLRVPRQKGKATRSLHYRDHVYKDQVRTVPSQAMVSVPSSSGHNSIDSSPSSLGLDSPFPSSRASPLSDTSVESNAVASAQIPTFHPAPSQAPTPPLFVPSAAARG